MLSASFLISVTMNGNQIENKSFCLDFSKPVLENNSGCLITLEFGKLPMFNVYWLVLNAVSNFAVFIQVVLK